MTLKRVRKTNIFGLEQENMLASIIKRDGTEVAFDSVKILNAITKANKASGEDMVPHGSPGSSPKRSAASSKPRTSAMWKRSRTWWKRP